VAFLYFIPCLCFFPSSFLLRCILGWISLVLRGFLCFSKHGRYISISLREQFISSCAVDISVFLSLASCMIGCFLCTQGGGGVHEVAIDTTKNAPFRH